MTDRNAWLVLKYVGEKECDWHVQGIFSSKPRAINACKDENHCFASYTIDEELPQEPVRVGEWTFPVRECNKALHGMEKLGGSVELSDPNSRYRDFNKGLGARFFDVNGNEIPNRNEES